MSQELPERHTPAAADTEVCETCRRVVAYKEVKKNTNGNKGRWFVSCNAIGADGTACNFFRWKKGSTKSPSNSPPSSQPGSPALVPEAAFPAQNAVPAPAPPPAASFPAQAAAPASAAVSKAQAHGVDWICPYQDCKSKRRAEDCQRNLCRKHCVLAGGCISRNHGRTDAALPAAPAPPLAPGPPLALAPAPPVALAPAPPLAAVVLPGPIPALPPTPVQVPVPPLVPAPAVPQPAAGGGNQPLVGAVLAQPPEHGLDARPDARFVSQMPAIFTEQFRREQQLAEQKRADEAARLAAERQAKQTVTLCVWTEALKAPLIYEFQTGFMWPYFTVSDTVLRDVGLIGDGSGARGSVQLYRHGSGTWAVIAVGHVVTLKEGERVYLKASTVVNPVDIDDYLQGVSKEVHLRRNLAGERKFVRENAKRKGSVKEESPEPRTSAAPPASQPGYVRPSLQPSRRPQAPKIKSESQLSPRVPSVSTTSAPKRARTVSPPAPKALPVEVITISSDIEEDPVPDVKAEAISDHDDDDFEFMSPKVEYISSGSSIRSISPLQSPSAGPSSDSAWPQDFPVNDIIAFFDAVETKKKNTKILDIFEAHFPGVAFRKSTYRENARKWEESRQSVREQSRGQNWSYFLKLRKGKAKK